MKESIYLIGQISTDKEITYSWRKEVREFFNSIKTNIQFDLIDPCDNEFNKEFISVPIKKDIFHYYDSGVDLIVPKDYNYVKRSLGCIANLNLYDSNKPMISTMFELAWYYTSQDKFVVGVFDGDWKKDKICNHPFVKSTVDVWCKTPIQAASIIIKYYERGL